MEVVTVLKAKSTRLSTEEPPIVKEILCKQGADTACQAAVQTVGHLALCYFYDGDAIFMGTAKIDGALQKFVPVTLCAGIL